MLDFNNIEATANSMVYKHTEYSGHMNFGSPYSCTDNCGSCDGAKCDYCHEIHTYMVESEEFCDEAEAFEFAKKTLTEFVEFWQVFSDVFSVVVKPEETTSNEYDLYLKYSVVEKIRTAFSTITEEKIEQLKEKLENNSYFNTTIKDWLDCSDIDVGDWWKDEAYEEYKNCYY